MSRQPGETGMVNKVLSATAGSVVDKPARKPNAQPSLTFVTCLESGPLEAQFVRLVESLRRWGGRFRDCPVSAYCPRFGPPLARSTNEAFERLGVSFRRIQPKNNYPWMGFYNKPLAVMAAEAEATTEQIAVMDCDILVLGEPEELELGPNEDFTAAAPNKTLGSAGPGDENEPYWESVCSLVGLKPDDLPWVTTYMDNARIRLYIQGGIFSYRRSTQFAQVYHDLFTRLNDAKVVSHASGSFFNDQVAISLGMVKSGVRWRALPESHNYNLLASELDSVDMDVLQEARLFHYHDIFWPGSWPKMLSLLELSRPEVYEWLREIGPMASPSNKPSKAVAKALRYLRAKQYARYEASCRRV